VRKKYGSLHTIAGSIKIGAYVVLFFGIAASIALGVSLTSLGGYLALIIILTLIFTLDIFILMLAMSASIYVFLDTEQNTRKSAELLEQMQSDQAMKEH
jgi:hypothetical protein